MSVIRQCARLGQMSVRRFGTSEVLRNEAEKTPAFKKLMAQMEQFQKEDGVDEVYLKGGSKDKILYGITVILTLSGLVSGMISAYELANM